MKCIFLFMKDKRMAQVIDGPTMSIGEILGGAAQDSNGAQLKFEDVKGSYPPVRGKRN
jgi:C-terminal processing protease CtpA/Prc